MTRAFSLDCADESVPVGHFVLQNAEQILNVLVASASILKRVGRCRRQRILKGFNHVLVFGVTAEESGEHRIAAADGGAVLVSQIVAGGVGLNIQAASVVVICEPQLKPTTEWQAIARAHRMGQLESVQVHRLLLEDSVDARILEILARKKQLFDDVVRVSTTAEAAPEAYDVSEAELAREIIAAERERLAVDPENRP